MSTELAIHHTVHDVEVMAKYVARSRLFNLDEPQAFTLMQLCIAEGLHPIQAIKRYHIIEGRPSMRADAMQAEFQRHGGKIRWVDTQDEICSAEFSHPINHPEPLLVTVTLKELLESGVAKQWDKDKKQMVTKGVYKKFPRQMLRARVISEGVRAIDPGVIVGIYTPEEVQDFDEPQPKTVEARVRELPKAHHAINHDNQTGHGSGAYAPPEAVERYRKFVNDYSAKVNSTWLDQHVGDDGMPTVKDLINSWQLGGHLHKYAKGMGHINAPDEVRSGQRDKFTAVWFDRDPVAVEKEAKAYCWQLWQDAEAKATPRPEDESQEIDDDGDWIDTEALDTEGATA